RVGVGRDRVDIKFFEQMKASIQQMHPQIRQTAASGKLLLREPRTDPGNARPPEPEATRMINFAEIASVQDAAGELCLALKAEVLGDHDRPLHVPGGF